MRVFLTTLTVTFAALSSAYAVEFTPAERLKLQPSAMEGPSLDTMGLRPGMDLKDSLKAIEAEFDQNDKNQQYKTKTESFSLKSKGVEINTTQFVSGVYILSTWYLPPGTPSPDKISGISLQFSSPASGNKLMSIARDIYYKDPNRAPTKDQIHKMLIDKYGKPSLEEWNEGIKTIAFARSSGRYVKCENLLDCTVALPQYELSNYQGGGFSVGNKADYLLRISIDRNNYDMSGTKVGAIHIKLFDKTVADRAAQADIAALVEKANEVAATAPAVALPKF
ncbi:hypothetical protein [Methylobacterium oryzae]|uniref:hypothetical protein n=1 Tax=Methylobacterium oryzae TaxID=334852 RepID=UPI001F1FAE70|nr:hypothetical protein [Methylobacterium oryzae]UIN38386.1 hypothetical protein LXM90_30860 [Methylobacterium oryzae]